MTTQSYLSYGIVDARSRPGQDLAQLRTLELDREDERRSRRTRSPLRRFLR